MNKTTSLSLIIAALAIAIVIGCGGENGSSSSPTVRGSGSISVISTFSEATRTVPGYADSLKVTITPPEGVSLPSEIANPFFLTRDITAVRLNNLKANASPYILNMEALTDGVVVGTAQRAVVVNRDKVHEIDVSANLDSEIAIIKIDGGDFLNAFPGSSLTLDSSPFFAFAKDIEGNTLFVGEGFKWSSSNTDVLTIDSETGLATWQGDGETLIRAELIEIPISSGILFEVFPRPASRVAYNIVSDGQSDVFIMDADGQNQRNLTNNEFIDRGADISHDGKRIVFRSNRENDNSEIFIMDASGLNQARLTYSGINFSPSFSANGEKIVFTRFEESAGHQIHVMDIDGQNVLKLTDISQFKINAEFSPDGSQIVFELNFNDGFDSDIYIMNADGSTPPRNLSLGSEVERSPSFSLDGTRIVFSSDHVITVMDLEGENRIALTGSPTTFDSDPTYSSDGRKIVFGRQQSSDRSVYIMNSDGLLQTRLNLKGQSPSIN